MAKLTDDEVALLYAAANNDTQTVLELLKKGTNPNVMHSTNTTPLHYATEFNNLKVMSALLKEGADRTAGDIYNRTPLTIAREYEYRDALNLLQASIGVKDSLHLAARTNDIHTIALLLEQDAVDINKKASNGNTALLIAACYNHAAISTHLN